MKIATGMQNPFPKSIQEMMHNKTAQIIYCYYCYKTTVGCRNSYQLGDRTISTRYFMHNGILLRRRRDIAHCQMLHVPLVEEFNKLCKYNEITISPTIIGALGTVSNIIDIHIWLGKLVLKIDFQIIQKACLLGTARRAVDT